MNGKSEKDKTATVALRKESVDRNCIMGMV